MPEHDDLPSRRRELAALARTMRGSVANLRAAAEALQSYPDMAAERRRRLLSVVAEESLRLGQQVQGLEMLATGRLELDGDRPVIGAEQLIQAVGDVARDLGLALEVTLEPTDRDLFVELALDSFVLAAATFLVELRREMAVQRIGLGTRVAEGHLLLDLTWHPEPTDLPRLLDWPGRILDAVPLVPGADHPGLRQVAREHDGEAWFNLGRDGREAHLRVLLPLANVPAVARV